MKMKFISTVGAMLVIAGGAVGALGQQFTKPYQVAGDVRVEIVNHFGKVQVSAPAPGPAVSDAKAVIISAQSAAGLSETDLKISSSASVLRVEVAPKDKFKRVDVSLTLPIGTRMKIETTDGEVRIAGAVASAEVRTETGTIAADVPTDDLRYSFLWTASRPRYLADIELQKVKEKAAGRFQISGRYSDPDQRSEVAEPAVDESESTPNGGSDPGPPGVVEEKAKTRAKSASGRVSLQFETERGIVLLNIPPNEVTSDLRERPLTNAAKAIIRSGDSLLMEAIRRAAPRYYGDYARTLPPVKLEPRFADRPNTEKVTVSSVKVASVRVTDVDNRALSGLGRDDFEVLESGAKREVLSVRPSTAPFNLVLLLDVSGSVDNYVTFIRKAARNFVNTVDAQDRISIVTFNEDVNVLTRFTTDKAELSASLDTFDAGGPTAYYDALAYTLADTLRPLKGDRTAIVVLTDGDDNRSFLPFDSMLASIQESGALIYPLYVPSSLIAGAQTEPSSSVDALRARYLRGELTSKAKGEGARLAQVSGGVYYEISKLSEIQAAYEDIVRQLRTAYEIEYRSELGGIDSGISPRLRIRTVRPNTYVQVRSVAQRSSGT